MLPITILALAAPLLTSALNIRSNMTTHVNPTRGNLGVYFCQGEAWDNGCTWLEAPLKKCVAIDLDKKGSFGPDKGLSCQIWSTSNCRWAVVNDIRFPGVDLGDRKLQAALFSTPKAFQCQPDHEK